MSFESPISVLQNLAGDEVAVVSGSAMGSDQPGVAILAKDESGNAQFLNLNASGELKVEATVDVALSASTDSILVYGSADVALQQDGERANSLKTYDAYVSGAIDNMGSNLGGKLDTLDSSVGAVETAVDNASSAISGSVVALGSDLGGKLDTLNAVDFATETTLAAFKSDNRSDLQAVSGAIDIVGAMLESTLTSIDGKDFATEATLLAISSSIAQNEYIDGKLRVDADVNVTLNYADDSVTVYGSEAVMLQQSSAHANALKVIDTDVSGAIVAMESGLGGKLDTLDSSVGAVETAVDNASSAISGSVVALGADLGSKFDTLNAVDFATETTLAAFKADNRSDLQAVSGAIDAMKVELEATLTSIDGKDFATEATLDAFKSENNGNLVALSSSLARFTFNGSNELLVNAAVDVALSASTDSITIYGDEGIPFSQISGSGEMVTVPLGSEGNSFLQAASGSIHSDVSGNGALLIGLLGSNSKNVLQSSVNDILIVSGAGNFNVTATALDIRPLTSADVVTVDNMVDVSSLATEATLSAVSGAINGLGVSVNAVQAAVEAIDAAQLGTVTVSATDLDIRDLSSATDSISAVQSGDWIVRKHTTSAAVSTANASVTSAEVLASNGDRMNATFFMDGNATCYIKLGGAASNSDFSIRLVNNGYYELPEGYTGAIHAVFSVTDAAIKLRMTELSYV